MIEWVKGMLAAVTMEQVIVQAIGIVAMAFNILSFQCKKQRSIIVMQFFGSLFFCVHFYLDGAMTGALLNAVAVVRALVYSNKEKLKSDHVAWLALFIGASIACYPVAFLWLDAPTDKWYYFVLELLPVVGMTLSTFSFRADGAKGLRLLWFFSSPLWLIYNICHHSIGGTVCECFAIVSILTAMFRLDRKPKEEPTPELK
ncbi:MAG: YgjV family protein [Ruminococcaceae bacterium]|nr:YgjV family protein [Oscillospiraceae bacterium]